MGTTLLCIDTPYILIPFGSILYHLGKLVLIFKMRKVKKRQKITDTGWEEGRQ